MSLDDVQGPVAAPGRARLSREPLCDCDAFAPTHVPVRFQLRKDLGRIFRCRDPRDIGIDQGDIDAQHLRRHLAGVDERAPIGEKIVLSGCVWFDK